MKIILFLIFIQFVFSCNQNKTRREIIASDLLNTKISDNINIFGSWAMCSMVSDGSMIQWNECVRVIFNQNGTGSINNTSFASFRWTLKDKELRILFFGENSRTVFPDTNYLTIFNKTNIGTELVLSLEKNNTSYYLTRKEL